MYCVKPTVGSNMVRHMILVLVLSLLLRVYYLIRCTHNPLWWVIMNSFDNTISCFWLCLLFLARSARFVLLGGMYTFSVLHGLCCLWETWVDRALKVTVIPTDLPCSVEMLGWLSFIFILHYYVLNELKMQTFIGFCACCYNRSLILVLCFAISFRGYIPSSFLWFVNMRLQSSCLLVTTFSLHHCIWDCRPVLSLTAFTSYWLLS